MISERHRAPRHQFIARIELTDMKSEKHISGQTKDLSLFGCFVETVTPFPEGTKFRLRISRGETHLDAEGRVSYSRPGSGMGIAFTMVEMNSLPVLDNWLADLRK
jgi:hypothetical protein